MREWADRLEWQRGRCVQREKRVSIDELGLVSTCNCLCVCHYGNPPRWSVEGEDRNHQSSPPRGVRSCLSLSYESLIDYLLLGRQVLSFTFICSCESFYIHSLSYIRIYKYVQERGGWGLIFPPAPESPFDVGRLLGVRATCLLVAWVVVVLQTFQSALGFWRSWAILFCWGSCCRGDASWGFYSLGFNVIRVCWGDVFWGVYFVIVCCIR